MPKASRGSTEVGPAGLRCTPRVGANPAPGRLPRPSRLPACGNWLSGFDLKLAVMSLRPPRGMSCEVRSIAWRTSCFSEVPKSHGRALFVKTLCWSPCVKREAVFKGRKPATCMLGVRFLLVFYHLDFFRRLICVCPAPGFNKAGDV